MDKNQQDTFRNLEKFRTDHLKPPEDATKPSTIFQSSWVKKGSFIIGMVLIIASITWTVYAFSDRKKEERNSPQADSMQQTTDQKSQEPAGEALHLKSEQDKTKSTTLPVSPPAHDHSTSRLSPPPQPKEKDYPAKNDQPMEIPDHLKERIQQEGVKPLEEKKK